jgi:hypothetical protein
LTVAISWIRTDYIGGKTLMKKIKVTYASGDTTLTVPTGLHVIDSFSVSPASVNTKYPSGQAVDGGTITLTVVNPVADAYLFVTVFGH